jgi:NADP-reducing hydrogenase subunit HndB
MEKIKTLADLKKMSTQLKARIDLRGKSNTENLVQIKIALATCGIASGAKDVMDYMTDELEKRSIDAAITQTGCMGYCYAEPTIEVTLPGKEPIVFGFVNVRKAGEIIDKYIRNGELVEGIIPMNYQTIDNN